MDEDIEMVKILAPLTETSYFLAACNDLAACNGHKEIVKILAPLIFTSNSSKSYAFTTSIYLAECYGHSEIVQFLAQFVKQSKC